MAKCQRSLITSSIYICQLYHFERDAQKMLKFVTKIDLEEAQANLYPFVAFSFNRVNVLGGLEIKYK